MTLNPDNKDDLAKQLAAASISGTRIAAINFSQLNSIVEHASEDMTATVQSGVTLPDFQRTIRRAGQWLPLDPPLAEKLTIADVLAFDRFGSRRLAYGTPRDYLIGVQVALASGELIKAGGKVVKNVAGYDLCKLFIGARHSLGFIVEATFKLRPLPEVETFLATKLNSLDELDRLVRALLDAAVEPILLDAHNLDGILSLVTAFAGMREDVDSQIAIAKSLGFEVIDPPKDSEFFWNRPAPQKASVLQSRTIETIQSIAPQEFLAHVGNGIIYFRGGAAPGAPPLPATLMDRVKKAYDPHEILPAYA